MLLQQNIFTSEIFVLNTNRFNGPKSFNFSGVKMFIVWLEDIFVFLLSRQGLLYFWGLLSNSFLALVPL